MYLILKFKVLLRFIIFMIHDYISSHYLAKENGKWTENYNYQ